MQTEQYFSWQGMLKTWNVFSIIFSMRNQYKSLIHHKNCKTAGNSSASDFSFLFGPKIEPLMSAAMGEAVTEL